jgi:hypothetical protein
MTEKIAKVVTEGEKRIPGIIIQLKKAGSNPREAATTDGYAFVSPSYFGITSGKLLTGLTSTQFDPKRRVNP